MSDLRAELIQVAAVALAFVQDLDTEIADLNDIDGADKGIQDVITERRRQDTKWGLQHHDPMMWLAILGEEFGEACQAALERMSDE